MFALHGILVIGLVQQTNDIIDQKSYNVIGDIALKAWKSVWKKMSANFNIWETAATAVAQYDYSGTPLLNGRESKIDTAFCTGFIYKPSS